MDFHREIILRGTYLFDDKVQVIEVWIEGIAETHCDYVVYFGTAEPFRITQNENWDWIEEGFGETDRASFVGELIDRKTM